MKIFAKIIPILFLLFLMGSARAQMSYSFTTAKTYSGAVTDTVYFYAPGALGYRNVQVGFQVASTDTTTNTTAPPPFVFTSDIVDLSTRQTAGTAANSDSTWIKAKPLNAAGRIIWNDSLNISGTSAITDVYIGSRTAGYSLTFTKIKAPYGIAIIHQLGGIVSSAVRFEYMVTWRIINGNK